jgi:hypothetical protein
MAGKIHCIDIVHINFESLADYSDEQLYQYMALACRSSKRRLIPKRIRWNAYRVTRNPDAMRIHLLLVKDQAAEPKEVLRFGFIPGPDFSRLL